MRSRCSRSDARNRSERSAIACSARARVGARERGDRIHAVEQEMRADPCLERAHAALRLGFDIAAPLVRHVEVAQRESARDRADGEISQHEFAGASVPVGTLSTPSSRLVVGGEPPGALGHERGDGERRVRARRRSLRARRASTSGRARRTRRPRCRAPPTAGTARSARGRVQKLAEMPWRASVKRSATSSAIRITASTLWARQKSGR